MTPIPRSMGWLTERARLVIVVAVIIGFVLASYVVGISRGLDHKITWSPLNDMYHLTNAISDNVYGLDHGYVGFSRVFESLKDSLGIEDFSADPSQMPSLQDKNALNAAIRKAASIPELHDIGPLFPPTLETYQKLNLIAPVGEDLGESALFSLAFRLFGLRIKSAYYLFFVVIGLSITAFVVQFRRNPVALSLLLFNVLAFHIFFYVQYFQPLVPTVYQNRFASTLAIIPAFHFAFLVLERRRLTLGSFGLTALQLAILLFALFIRSSGTWAILGIVGLTVMEWLIVALAAPGQPWRTRFDQATRTVRFWPAILLVLGFAGFLVYRNDSPHPLFRTIDNQPHHMIWHNAWIGLALHPDWPKYHPEQSDPGADTNVFNMTLTHLQAVGLGQEFTSTYNHGHPKIGLHEAYIRLKYLEFVRQHPIYMLQLALYYKPRAFIREIASLYFSVGRDVMFPVFAAILGAVVLRVGRGRVRPAAEDGTILPAVGATALLFVSSLAPVIWAYPANFVMSDQIWMTTTLAATLAWAGVCGLAHVIRFPAWQNANDQRNRASGILRL